jgi:molybdopterin synthase catalytic subunit
MRIVVDDAEIAPERELAAFARGGQAGAMASFIGYCRAASGGRAVERLELEHYPGFTEAEAKRLAEAVFDRHGLIDLLVIHRVGAIAAGQAIVLVAALSEHRAPALAAVSELMDLLKTQAPIWKREIGPARGAWIEPTDQDRRAAAGWRAKRCQEGSP